MFISFPNPPRRVEKNRASNKLSNENKISTGWKKTVLRTNHLMKTNQLILAPFRAGAKQNQYRVVKNRPSNKSSYENESTDFAPAAAGRGKQNQAKTKSA
jgi:hypothetical protein